MPSLRLRERFRRAGNSDDTDRDGAAQSGVADGMLASAPVPLDWKRFADRRPRRLKRGKHFVGEPKLLHREARDAAESAGMVAVVEKDQQGKWGYIWVQFVDAEVNEDEPCPVCGSHELLRLNNEVLRCPSCDSMLAFVPHPLEMPPRRRPGDPADAPLGESSPIDDPSAMTGDDRGDLAEIVSTRALRPDGTPAEAFSTDEALTLETIIRSYQPRLRVNTMISAHVGDQRVFVSREPHWSDLGKAGMHAIRVQFPARFLRNHTFRLKVAVKVDDGSGADPITLVRRGSKWIVLQPELPEDGAPPIGEPFVRPALEWSTESVDPEEVEADFVSIEDGSLT